jgi:hypothetical protein
MEKLVSTPIHSPLAYVVPNDKPGSWQLSQACGSRQQSSLPTDIMDTVFNGTVKEKP